MKFKKVELPNAGDIQNFLIDWRKRIGLRIRSQFFGPKPFVFGLETRQGSIHLGKSFPRFETLVAKEIVALRVAVWL